MQNGCTTCHQFPTGGAPGPGTNLSNGSPMFGLNQKEIQAWLAGGANAATHVMPNYTSQGPTKIAQIAQVIASLKAGKPVPLQQ